jgi:hypothetical protein
VTVVVVLVLGWWDQADLAVQAAVVEPVDVFGDGDGGPSTTARFRARLDASVGPDRPSARGTATCREQLVDNQVAVPCPGPQPSRKLTPKPPRG